MSERSFGSPFDKIAEGKEWVEARAARGEHIIQRAGDINEKLDEFGEKLGETREEIKGAWTDLKNQMIGETNELNQAYAEYSAGGRTTAIVVDPGEEKFSTTRPPLMVRAAYRPERLI